MAFRPRRVNVEMNKVGRPGRALQQGWTMHEVWSFDKFELTSEKDTGS